MSEISKNNISLLETENIREITLYVTMSYKSRVSIPLNSFRRTKGIYQTNSIVVLL